ncbi:MAG TPA: dihydrodipicolinate synthase family protein [Nitrolancea sp.]|nr:dihydrodipicolinate synthase family protein [Nitrolancea sp.]
MAPELRGIFPAMVTPFNRSGDIDEEGLRSEVQVLLSAEVHGLAICSSIGEGHTLALEETVEVSRIVIDEAGGKVPVITGILGDSTRAVIRAAKELGELDVAALLIAPVHYRYSPGELGHIDFYREIDRATRIPVIVDNVVPWNALSPKLLLSLEDVPQVIGVNQCTGGLSALAELIALNDRQLKIFSAHDDLLYPALSLGVVGAISAIAAVLPDLCLKLWHAVEIGDHEAARELHRRILPVWGVLNHPNLPARVKAAIELRGRRVGSARHPLLPVSANVRAEIDSALDQAGVLGRFS